MLPTQCIQIFTSNCANYFDEISVLLEINEIHTLSSYQKLNVSYRKAHFGQKSFSFVGPYFRTI